MIKSKFYNIKFPFFGFIKKPFQIKYKGNGLEIQLEDEGSWFKLDTRDLSKANYLSRLLDLRVNSSYDTILFDVTARNLEELIHAKCSWGLDRTGTEFDLSKKANYTLEYRKVRRVKENYIWLEEISYPFQVGDIFKDEHNLKNLYVGIIHVDFSYVIYDFNYFHKDNKTLRL